MVKNIDFTIFVFVRLFLNLLVHLLDCSFVHWSVCCGRVVVWSFGRRLFVCSSIRFVYFLFFLEGRFPEAAYFYGISQDSKFTLSLLQLTDKEVTNATNENGKASIQRLAEKIAHLDPEVVLLYITDEKIQLLMTQTVC